MTGIDFEELAIERVPIDQLRRNPNHTRKNCPKQVRRISKSIRSFRFNAPLLVDDNLMVLSGHARLEACKSLGFRQVPVIRLRHLGEDRAAGFAIAENKLAETGEWDFEALGRVLGELHHRIPELDFSLDATGFDDAEIEALIFDVDETAAAEPDEPPIDPGPAVCRPGDRWTLGRHVLVCGSSLEQDAYDLLMSEERAAMVFTDPPYGVAISGHVKTKGKSGHREFAMGGADMSSSELTAFFTQAWRLCSAFSLEGSLHYAFIDGAHLFDMLTSTRAVYDRQVSLCVWHKTNAGMGSFYRQAHELVVVSKKGSAPHQNHIQLGRFGRNRTTVWSHAGAGVFLKSAEDADLMGQHPTPKPVRLIVDALLDASSPNDVVLEPFCGSGSTLIACERTQRRCRAIELDPLYCDLTIRRWRRHCGQEAVRQDGMTFTRLEAEGGDHG
jgi:DNA modification methylase